MKCVISKETLLHGLQLVQTIVSSRTTLPILNNALLRAENGQLTIAATDLDVGLRVSVEASVDKAGATTVPAKKFFSIVKELPANEVVIEVDAKNHVSIRSGASFFKLVGLGEENYPAFPKTEGARTFRLKQSEFKDMIRRTAYAMSADESRYVLNGLLFSAKENKLTIVATDGRRMALVEQEIEIPTSQECEVILPTKAVMEVQRILLSDDGDVTINIADNQVVFECANSTLFSKLVDGKYPNYRQVIPAEPQERVVIERELLLYAVHRVSLLSVDRSTSIKLSFTQGSLEITSTAPDIGEAHETIPVNYRGRDFTIAFNPYFLMDPLKVIEADEVYLDFIDELSPGVIKYNRPFLYVIMPMRTA